MLRFDPTPFSVLNGLVQWVAILGAFLVVTFVVAFCIALLTGGTKRGPRDLVMHLSQGLRDLIFVSPRRILAIAQLVIRESIRRKALLVFVLFALLFMFASWFISDPGERPEMQAIVHITFVLKAITWLTIPVVLLLACWGLPNDIKQRSLHTVVTKPARRSEVLMGRILGFSAIGSLILAVMGVAGYIWIKRQVPDQAQSLLVSRVPIYGELGFTDRNGNPSRSGVNTGDIWEFRSYVEGATAATAIWTFDDVTSDQLVTITDPVTGESSKALRLEYNFEAFRTHKGRMGEGLKAQFRVMNDLRTQMAHVFSGITDFQAVGDKIAAGDFQEAASELQRDANGIQTGGLKISSRLHGLFFSRFRHLSDMMKPFVGTEGFEAANQFVEVSNAAMQAAGDEDDEALGEQMDALGELMSKNADALSKHIVDRYAETGVFEVIEYKRSAKKQDASDAESDEPEEDTTTFYLTSTLPTPGGEAGTLDLLDDLTHGDRLRVAVACLDSGQYLGMARPDLYIRTPDRPFESGYFKAVCGTWLMVLLIVVIGVTASTFVKGPVATLLTATLFIVGLSFHGFLEDLATGEAGKGFGAIESIVRIVDHKNPQTELEQSRAVSVMQGTDKVIVGGLWVVYKTIPNFNVYGLSPYVANGFDVPFSAGLLPAIAMTLAYLFPCLFIGYFSLRLRELEAK